MSDIGRVTYPLRDGWVVVVEQDFGRPATGPTRLEIKPAHEPHVSGSDEPEFGAYEPAGIQQAHLREVPIREARKALEDLRLERMASRIASRIPEGFIAAGDVALARLAVEYVRPWGTGVRNPVSAISKACSPHVQGTWAARVRRARERGFLVGNERGPDTAPSVGPSAIALLGDAF